MMSALERVRKLQGWRTTDPEAAVPVSLPDLGLLLNAVVALRDVDDWLDECAHRGTYDPGDIRPYIRAALAALYVTEESKQ